MLYDTKNENIKKFISKLVILGGGDKAQLLKVLATLPVDLDLILSIHTAANNCLEPESQRISTFFWPPEGPATSYVCDTQTYTQAKLHIHKIKM